MAREEKNGWGGFEYLCCHITHSAAFTHDFTEYADRNRAECAPIKWSQWILLLCSLDAKHRAAQEEPRGCPF